MSTRARAAAAAALLAIAFSGPARAGLLDEARRTTPQALSVNVQRHVLENGLVVLLAPDNTVSSVTVLLTFRAGALQVPPGLAGLAHLVEHMTASGHTPETDYGALLEARRARSWNAHTGYDTLSFESTVPAEELPLALWIQADRLARLPALIDEPEVERSRRIVLEERALTTVDAPYGLVEEHLHRRLYAAPHPLHDGVLGSPAELAHITAADAVAFARTHLVPANGVLTVVGRFDPALALRLVREGLGRLPAGRRAATPALAPYPATFIDRREEPLSREPRVTLAWRFPGLPQDDAMALRVGAIMLTFLTDGAWGMRIAAGLEEYEGEATFQMNLTLPYDEPMKVVHDDAAGFLRMLTHKEIPLELQIAGNLALDRADMLALDTLEGRADLLTALELRPGPREAAATYLGRRWSLDGSFVRDVARTYLRQPSLVLHARPTRPRPARAERE